MTKRKGSKRKLRKLQPFKRIRNQENVKEMNNK